MRSMVEAWGHWPYAPSVGFAATSPVKNGEELERLD